MPKVKILLLMKNQGLQMAHVTPSPFLRKVSTQSCDSRKPCKGKGNTRERRVSVLRSMQQLQLFHL